MPGTASVPAWWFHWWCSLNLGVPFKGLHNTYTIQLVVHVTREEE